MQARPFPLRLPGALTASFAAIIFLACSGSPDDASNGANSAGDGDGDSVGPGSGGIAGDGDSNVVTPPDCTKLQAAGFEVCSSSATTCEVVFENSAGCTEVCATAGLTCAAAYDNVQGSCAADMALPAVSCDSGHESDYCVCEGSGTPSTGDGDGDGDGDVNPSSGGSSSGGSSSGGSGSGGSSSGGSPNIGPRTCGCETPAGEYGTVNSTIKIGAGQTYDGGCKIFRAHPDHLGDGSQDEGQLPIFELEQGATLRNVVIGASGADGIHINGDATLENIHWQDVGEDAMTIKEDAEVHLDCGSAYKGSDKIFQINAYTELHISNFTANGAGKFIRELGGDDFDIDVYIDHCDISDMSEAIFRTDSDSSHVTLTNTRYSDIGDSLFLFGSTEVNGNSSQSTVSNNQSY